MAKRLIVLVLYAPLALVGLRWGLPTAERVGLWLGRPLPPELPDYAYVALHSMHPDEHKILEPLANMNPRRLDFNPRHFDHPTLHIYITGAALGCAGAAGLIDVSESQRFYLDNPDQMARVYLTGRLVTVAFGAGLLLVVAALAERIVGSPGAWVAPLCLVASASFVVHCHYLTTDLPLTFWITLSALVSLCRSSRRAVWWSAAVAGLAAGTKYYGFIAVLFPLYRVVSQRGSNRRRAGTALGVVAVAAAVFLLTSPYVVLAPREFKATGYDVWREVLRQNDEPVETYLYTKETGPGWFRYAAHVIPVSMGAPLFGACVAGLVVAVARRTPHSRLLLLGTLPYFFLIGAMPFHLVKHSLPLVPFLCVCGATLPFFKVGRRWRIALGASLGLCVVLGLMHSLNHAWVLRTEDTRLTAAMWVRNTVPASVPVATPWHPSALGVPVNRRERSVITFCPIMEGLKPARLSRGVPPVFLMTEFEYRQYMRLRTTYPRENAFFRELLSGRVAGIAEPYRVLSLNPDVLLPYPPLRPAFPPHDWIFYSPRVVIAAPESGLAEGSSRNAGTNPRAAPDA